MNNEQQTWILKRPISVDDTAEYNLDFSKDYKWIDISGSEVDELFVPLSLSGLTRQVEELLQNYGARFFADYEIDRIAYKENIEAQEAGGRMESRARKEFAEQIVLLLLGKQD